jgi:hypothetical protein
MSLVTGPRTANGPRLVVDGFEMVVATTEDMNKTGGESIFKLSSRQSVSFTDFNTVVYTS